MLLKSQTEIGQEVVKLYGKQGDLYGEYGNALVQECPEISFAGTNTDNHLIKVGEVNSVYCNVKRLCFMKKLNSSYWGHLSYKEKNGTYEIFAVGVGNDLKIIRENDIVFTFKINNNPIVQYDITDITNIINEILAETGSEYTDVKNLVSNISITDIVLPNTNIEGATRVKWLSLFFEGYKKYLDIKEGVDHTFSNLNFPSSKNFVYLEITNSSNQNILFTFKYAKLTLGITGSGSSWRIDLFNNSINKRLYTGTTVRASDVVFNFILHFSNTSETESYSWDLEMFEYWANKYNVAKPVDFSIVDGTNYMERWSIILSRWIWNTVHDVFGYNVSSVEVTSYELGIPLEKKSDQSAKVITTEGQNANLIIQRDRANNKTEFFLVTNSSDSFKTYSAERGYLTPFYLGFSSPTVTLLKDGEEFYAQTVDEETADFATKKGSGIALAFMIGDEQMYIARTAGTRATPFEKPKTEVQRIIANGTLEVSADTFGDTGGVICVCSGKGQGVSGSVGGNGYVQRIEIPANLRENIVIQASFERNIDSNGTTGGTASRRDYQCVSGDRGYLSCSSRVVIGSGSGGGAGGMNVTANVTIGSKSFVRIVYGGGGGGGFGGECCSHSDCSNSDVYHCNTSNWGCSYANGGQGGLTGAGTGTRNNPSGRTGGNGLSYNATELNSEYAEWTDSACIVVYKYDE